MNTKNRRYNDTNAAALLPIKDTVVMCNAFDTLSESGLDHRIDTIREFLYRFSRFEVFVQPRIKTYLRATRKIQRAVRRWLARRRVLYEEVVKIWTKYEHHMRKHLKDRIQKLRTVNPSATLQQGSKDLLFEYIACRCPRPVKLEIVRDYYLEQHKRYQRKWRRWRQAQDRHALLQAVQKTGTSGLEVPWLFGDSSPMLQPAEEEPVFDFELDHVDAAVLVKRAKQVTLQQKNIKELKFPFSPEELVHAFNSKVDVGEPLSIDDLMNLNVNTVGVQQQATATRRSSAQQQDGVPCGHNNSYTNHTQVVSGSGGGGSDGGGGGKCTYNSNVAYSGPRRESFSFNKPTMSFLNGQLDRVSKDNTSLTSNPNSATTRRSSLCSQTTTRRRSNTGPKVSYRPFPFNCTYNTIVKQVGDCKVKPTTSRTSTTHMNIFANTFQEKRTPRTSPTPTTTMAQPPTKLSCTSIPHAPDSTKQHAQQHHHVHTHNTTPQQHHLTLTDGRVKLHSEKCSEEEKHHKLLDPFSSNQTTKKKGMKTTNSSTPVANNDAVAVGGGAPNRIPLPTTTSHHQYHYQGPPLSPQSTNSSTSNGARGEVEGEAGEGGERDYSPTNSAAGAHKHTSIVHHPPIQRSPLTGMESPIKSVFSEGTTSQDIPHVIGVISPDRLSLVSKSTTVSHTRQQHQRPSKRHLSSFISISNTVVGSSSPVANNNKENNTINTNIQTTATTTHPLVSKQRTYTPPPPTTTTTSAATSGSGGSSTAKSFSDKQFSDIIPPSLADITSSSSTNTTSVPTLSGRMLKFHCKYDTCSVDTTTTATTVPTVVLVPTRKDCLQPQQQGTNGRKRRWSSNDMPSFMQPTESSANHAHDGFTTQKHAAYLAECAPVVSGRGIISRMHSGRSRAGSSASDDAQQAGGESSSATPPPAITTTSCTPTPTTSSTPTERKKLFGGTPRKNALSASSPEHPQKIPAATALNSQQSAALQRFLWCRRRHSMVSC